MCVLQYMAIGLYVNFFNKFIVKKLTHDNLANKSNYELANQGLNVFRTVGDAKVIF